MGCVREEAGKQPFCFTSVRVVDAKATADLLLDDIVWSVGAGVGYLLVNCGA